MGPSTRPRNDTRPKKRSRPQREKRADEILETARAAEPANTEKTISVSVEDLQEIRKRLISTRAVVVSCAQALATYSADHIQLTLEDDVVKKLDCLELTLKLILTNQPFRCRCGVKSRSVAAQGEQAS